MNFLRSTYHVAVERQSVNETPASAPAPVPVDARYTSKTGATLEGLIAEDRFPQSNSENYSGDFDGVGDEDCGSEGVDVKSEGGMIGSHSDVSEEEGWITIPSKKLPDNWDEAPDIHSLREMDRSFVFPGEQICILACLSAYKLDTEIITPFKIAAMMSRNGQGQSPVKLNDHVPKSASTADEACFDGQDRFRNAENLLKEDVDREKDISSTESLLRKESRKRQTETILQRFKNSHFFVRIAESGEQLWSKKSSLDMHSESSQNDSQNNAASGIRKTKNTVSCSCATIDKGNIDATVSGGIARDTVHCSTLPNGDIMVLLQVNIGVDSFKDPVLEILQFEKDQKKEFSSQSQGNVVHPDRDPYGELLKWLLPLDNTFPPLSRPLSPPLLSSNSGVGFVSQKTSLSTSAGSQLFSFGHSRSYSMSSLPQNTVSPPQPLKVASSKPKFEIEDWDQFSSKKMLTPSKGGNDRLLSFRGVPLEQERFSIRCGLEGICVPGRRWRRKLEIIQPVIIRSFSAECNADDILCVQIKNVCPESTPDIVIYIDAISIVFERASTVGPPSSLPIACIEAGDDHNLPNLALRKCEEHSFILKPKPAMSMLKDFKVSDQRSLRSSLSRAGNVAARLHAAVGKMNASAGDQYAIVVTCRCNYTDSKLFFKQPTSWRPRVPRDVMVAVASEIAGQSPDPSGKVLQLPIQVLTLQATNLTSEYLTLTVLAPASFTAPPSVVSLNSSPSTPVSPFIGFSDIQGRVSFKHSALPAPFGSESRKENGDVGVTSPVSGIVSSNGLACTHLWLQSRVPLGRVPPQSTATIKLELLPLTDGIITLDTLQIHVKEKGFTYIPEHSLKIYATSSISTGII